MNAENADDLDKTLALPGVVRLAAAYVLCLGVALMIGPIAIWLIVNWVLRQ